jgi:hypothetical protein
MMRTAGLDDGSPSTTLTRLELKASMIETSSRVIALVLCLRQRRKCRPGSSVLGSWGEQALLGCVRFWLQSGTLIPN